MNLKAKLRICSYCFAVFGLLFTACQNEALTTADKSEIVRINQVLVSGQPLAARDFESLKQFREKYPKAPEVKQTYKNALVRREDWTSLQSFLLETPINQLSREDKTTLGKAYFKDGDFEEAAKIGKLMMDENPNDLEAASIFANAAFSLGRYDEAASALDRLMDQYINQKRADEIGLRGMIYFSQNDNPKAIDLLKKALEISPDFVPAANGLSRIYAAQGNSAQAEEYAVKVEKIFEKITAIERIQTKLVALTYKLQEAYREKRFEEVVSLVKQMLPEAEDKNKPALYQYLANAYQALGKQQEAQQAMNEAAKLTQK